MCVCVLCSLSPPTLPPRLLPPLHPNPCSAPPILPLPALPLPNAKRQLPDDIKTCRLHPTHPLPSERLPPSLFVFPPLSMRRVATKTHLFSGLPAPRPIAGRSESARHHP